MQDDFLWENKYRPTTIEECILTPQLKSIFQQFVDQKNVPNITLSGTPGVGKTTVARAMLEQLGCDYIVINGSLNGNIDTLRNEIMQFASAVSLTGGRKYVILDEADYINPNSTQPALRGFIQDYSKNCGFILTCNYENKIIEPLKSRCPVIDFKVAKADIPKLAVQFMKRIINILDTENVVYDKAVIAEVINKFYPDWRRTLNELQKYSASGAIDTGVLKSINSTSIDDIVECMKNKDYTKARNWVSQNIDGDSASFFRMFYNNASKYFAVNSVPALILLIGKYQYQAAFVADAEINIMAFITEIMVECEFV